MTQCEKVVNYMIRHGSITQAEAFTELGVYRLASRISDLRKMGYNIDAEMESGKNRDGESVIYKRYSLCIR